jgi:serine/threonine protein kinase
VACASESVVCSTRFYGSFVDGHAYHLVFELAPNGSLRDYLRTNLVEDERQVVAMCQQMADALEYLHQDLQGKASASCQRKTRWPIAHRDLKSDNVLLMGDNRLVICDFAMSIQLDLIQVSGNNHQQVRSSTFRRSSPCCSCSVRNTQIGTARYMAPEILAGTIGNEPNALLRSDVYALSLIFWEVVSRCASLGRRVHSTNDTTRHDTSADGRLERHDVYLMPYEEQLAQKKFDRNPKIIEMAQIVSSEPPFNRPLIRPSWKTNSLINELIRTMEQCWDGIPEARISVSLVAYRLREL